MADYKQYIAQVQENGNVMISEDVVTTIVTHAIEEVEGVNAINTKSDLINKKNWNKGIKLVIADDNELTIDCNVIIEYGHAVVEVAKNIQQAVTNAVESMTGVKVVLVNVNVCGIARQ